MYYVMTWHHTFEKNVILLAAKDKKCLHVVVVMTCAHNHRKLLACGTY